MNELSEYVTDVNADIAKKSIACFGTIIIRLPSISLNVTDQLKNFLMLKINYVTTATMLVLKDVLRKYPNYIEHFYAFINKDILEQINDGPSKQAFVWILGQFGEQIDDSPYILEKLFEDDLENAQVDMMKYLAVASTKLFFKRSPEMHGVLSKVYKHVLKTSCDADLRQKVMFYYKLMSQNMQIAEKIICSSMA